MLLLASSHLAGKRREEIEIPDRGLHRNGHARRGEKGKTTGKGSETIQRKDVGLSVLGHLPYFVRIIESAQFDFSSLVNRRVSI